MAFTDYTCTVAGLDWPDVDRTWEADASVTPRAEPRSAHSMPGEGRPQIAPLPASPAGGRQPPPIEPDEDAYSMPPRPRISDLRKLHAGRMVDVAKATRGVEASDESAALFQEANDNAELDGMGDGQMRTFLRFLRERKFRGRKLANNTIRKHFANIAKFLDYGGPQVPGGDRTACKCGLYGFDAAGLPRPAPALFRDDLPPIEKPDKPVPELEDVDRWLEACAGLTWPKGSRKVPAVEKGLWLCCLIVFLRNTGIRLESLIKAEWTMVKGSWLHLPEWAVKKKKQPLNVYLNRWALAAAEAVRTEDARIFSWRCTESRLCNIIEEIFPDEEMFRSHRLRAMLYNDLVVAGHEIVAQCQLGHKGGVGQQFYAKFRRIAPRVMESDKILPQPHTTKVKLPLANPQGVLF